MSDRIVNLKNHYIVCGAGRTGIHIATEFVRIQAPCVLIEQSPAIIEGLQNRFGDALDYVTGDATEDEILESARIEQARGLITTLADDKENVFVVLTARSLNPKLRIVARINDEGENAEKIRKAGADKIVSPNDIGGKRIASEMIRPEVVVFLDQMLLASEEKKRLRFTQLAVDDIKLPASQSNKLHIFEVGQHTELLVLAIKREGQYHYKPRGNTELHRSTESQSGDVLVVIGTQEQLDKARGNVKRSFLLH